MRPLPEINTRFTLPIISPMTGKEVSAETLYNDCCADLGYIVRNNISDLVFDNLKYDDNVNNDALYDAVVAWGKNVRKLIEGKE